LCYENKKAPAPIPNGAGQGQESRTSKVRLKEPFRAGQTPDEAKSHEKHCAAESTPISSFCAAILVAGTVLFRGAVQSCCCPESEVTTNRRRGQNDNVDLCADGSHFRRFRHLLRVPRSNPTALPFSLITMQPHIKNNPAPCRLSGNCSATGQASYGLRAVNTPAALHESHRDADAHPAPAVYNYIADLPIPRHTPKLTPESTGNMQ
jgi:hypothetical protein